MTLMLFETHFPALRQAYIEWTSGLLDVYTGIDGNLLYEQHWIIKLAQYCSTKYEQYNGSLCLTADSTKIGWK